MYVNSQGPRGLSVVPFSQKLLSKQYHHPPAVVTRANAAWVHSAAITARICHHLKPAVACASFLPNATDGIIQPLNLL